MTDIITSAGYIITARNGETIDAIGATADEAWADFLATMAHANVRVVDDVDGAESVAEDMIETNYVRASDFRIHPATAALLAKVKAEGGAITWEVRDGVRCTRDEEQEAFDAAFHVSSEA